MDNLSKSRFGPFVIDIRERELHRDGQPVPLTPKAFDLLAAFVEEPGRLITKDQLLKKVWPDTFVEESNLAYNVFAIRKALGDTAEDGHYIETVPKRGYRFTATPTVVSSGTEIPIIRAEAAEPFESSQTAPTLVRTGSFTFWSRRSLVAGAAVLAIPMYFIVPSRRAPPATEPLRALPLTSLVGTVRSPSLSPDGSYVVFTWTGPKQDNPDLYVQQIGAGSPLRLTTDPGHDYSPSWSPDGRTIAFLRRQPGAATTEVRLIPPLGGSDRKIADVQPRMPFYRPLSLGWCPNSACLLATDSPGPGKADAVFAIALESGEKRQLTSSNDIVADADPAMSPDGRSLIFRRDTSPFSGAFYRVSLDSQSAPEGEPVRLTPTMSAGRPAFTPASREFLFAARGALWRLDALSGGAPARLPFVGQDGSTPVVSRAADGRQRLVYVRSFADSNVWRLDTGAKSTGIASSPLVAIASTRADSTPSLSPDGRRLAFLSDRSGEPQIWVADTDGAHAVQLTSAVFGSSPGFPRWSPDGKTIVFHGDPEGRPDVLVVPAGGGKSQTLTPDVPNAGFPSFSRNGQWIYFCVVRAGEARVWKMPALGGAPVQVTPNAGTRAIESTDGRDLYYVAAVDGSSALWRVPLSGGAPVKVLEHVILGNFDVVEEGIYYMDRASGEAGRSAATGPAAETRLRYYDFSTRRSMTVARNLGALGFGLSASPDGRSVFLSRVDSSTNELMLVDDFR